ncbi:hypothetical protein HJC23_001750 [Cyclotella cryptica]|uniref:Uncharacterized protein n=1 Tax=Cyclotella cryptica TaxID=29204 RepID=A0ABD3QRK4_9STRA
MNRISSLKQRTAANKHRGNSSLQTTPPASDLEYGRYTDQDDPIDASVASDSHGSSDKNSTRSPPSSSLPNNHSNCASTVDSTGSTNHSSIFSKSDDGNDDRQDMMVKGGYVPSKNTLGLELVASPSLLRQVLTPPPCERVTDFPSGASSSTGGSWLRSKNSLGGEMTDPAEESFGRDADRGVVEDLGGDTQEEEEDNAEGDDDATDDIFDDDESEYSAMQTVAETVVSAKTKEAVGSDSLPQQRADVCDVEIAVVPMRQTLSMRSAKSSEGMEVDFHTVFDKDDDDDDKGEENSSIGQPFDEGNARIVASSKAAALMVTRSNQPTSCLKPSSFAGQRTNLPSPAVVQDRRVGRAARLAKFRKSFDKRHLDVVKIDLTTTNMKQKTRPAGGEVQQCFSSPVVSFAENLEETHPMDEVKNDLVTTSASEIRPDETLGHPSPTGVQEFFSVNDDDVNNSKKPHKGQEENSVDSGNSGPNSNLNNRLARNQEALKSIALARGSARDTRSKKSKDDDGNYSADELLKNDVPTPPDEVTTPPIVQSVSELEIPQFSPSLDGNASKEGNVNESFVSAGENAGCDSSHGENPQDQVDTAENPSIEVDTSALLEINTSLDSTSSKVKRFLPRLRLKTKGNSPTAVSKQPTNVPANISNGGRKRSIRSKFFRSKSSSKKEEKAQALDLAKVKDVDHSLALLSLSPQTISTEEESRKDSGQMPTPCSKETVQKWLEPPLPKEFVHKERENDEVLNRSITIDKSQLDSSVTAAAMKNFQASAVSKSGMDTSEVTETSFVSADDEVDPTATGENNQFSSLGNIKPASSFGARSSSTPSSKWPLHSASSLHSNRPTLASLEPLPTESKSRSTPSRARSMDTHNSAPLLNNSSITQSSGGKPQGNFDDIVLNNSSITQSSGGKPQGNFDGIADFTDWAVSDVRESLSEASVDNHTTTTDFRDELAQGQIQKMLRGFGNPRFVGAELSGECESGVEVEWTNCDMPQNEFLDESVEFDTTAISAELEHSLPRSKLENDVKGDDISWPSDVESCNQHDSIGDKRLDEDLPLQIVDDSQGSETDNNAIIAIEETSTKSGYTKSSSLHPRMLFRSRSKNNKTDHTKLQDEEETMSDFKHFVSSEKKRNSHSSKKGRRAHRNYKSIRDVKRNEEDDLRSIEDDSEEYSSEDYSSDDQEDVVATIATSLQKGFTGIVDMMETAFAFGAPDETADYESESSESEEEDDDDSYIQRKMARRRNKQRKLLQDARRRIRSSQRQDIAKPLSGERRRISKSSKSSRDVDGASIGSDEDHSPRVQRRKSSRRHQKTSGRGASSRRVESRHQDSRR